MSAENSANTETGDKYKRKRKKSFLKNARKYAKKGCFGRGSQLEADTYQYFVRIMEAYREGFESDEDKSIFVNNVFEQTVGQEINCCCNQVGCRVVEMLIPFANDNVLDRFMKEFSKDIRPLCSDRFASHVLEALVIEATNKFLKPTSSSDEFKIECKNFTLKISKFLLNNLEDYLWDTYGNHIIRTCLESLAQIPREKEKKHGQPPQIEAKEEDSVELPEEFTAIVKDYGERVIHWPQFVELSDTEVTSGFLQVLLKTLKKVDKSLLKKYLEKLNTENFGSTNEENPNPNILPPVFLSKPAMMVLETALTVASKKMFSKIYVKCFAGRLVKLATIRNTNFTIQKLVMNCKDKTEFEAIIDELLDSFKEIVEAGHTGVIWALGEACKRLGTRQGSFVQSLMKSLDCLEPEENQNHFIICLSKFKPYNSNDKHENLHKDKLNLHGTLILQIILEFNKPIKIVNGLLNMETATLKNLFSNTMGSHIVDSYVKSGFVGEKSREKLTRKMKGFYQDLASTKFGSRSFEALFSAANLKTKLAIMDEMVYKDGAWSNSDFGKIIASKINLNLYKRSKEDWKNNLNSTGNKADNLFSEILK